MVVGVGVRLGDGTAAGLGVGVGTVAGAPVGAAGEAMSGVEPDGRQPSTSTRGHRTNSNTVSRDASFFISAPFWLVCFVGRRVI